MSETGWDHTTDLRSSEWRRFRGGTTCVVRSAGRSRRREGRPVRWVDPVLSGGSDVAAQQPV